MVTDISGSSALVLPHFLLEDILNRLEDPQIIAYAQSTCKDFWEAGKYIRSLRIVCLDEYHKSVRDFIDLEPLARSIAQSQSIDRGESSKSGSTDGTPELLADAGGTLPKDDGQSLSTILKSRDPIIFRDRVVQILRYKRYVVQLRIEVEPKLQAKAVPDGERRRTDHWLSDPFHLRRWVPYVQSTLEHLCIVDYGQQAIMRRSSILKILSQSCKLLKTLDLRNMFIDTSGFEKMLEMESLTLRCAKVTGGALQDINDQMPNLQTLALLGVFGIEQGVLTFEKIKVLCLGLSTPAKVITANLPELVKLQLKMHCPEKLVMIAEKLKFVAFNLEVQESSQVELRSKDGLQELLYGASSFVIFSRLVDDNPNLEKIFLDIPCMGLGEDGMWKGVLKGVPLSLPSFKKLQECDKLQVLNVGPGLWYSMEINLNVLLTVEKWPPINRLILHMIPQELESSLSVLRYLLKPTVMSLEIYIHVSSPVNAEQLIPEVDKLVSDFGQNFKKKYCRGKRALISLVLASSFPRVRDGKTEIMKRTCWRSYHLPKTRGDSHQGSGKAHTLNVELRFQSFWTQITNEMSKSAVQVATGL